MDIRTPGSGLVERLKARERRRPKIGLSPMFYARFGLSDPWLDTSVEASPEDVESAFTFISARPYFQMMRRLAMRRWWRQRRERRFESHRIGLRTSTRRRFPGETAVSAKPFVPPWGGFGPTIDMGSMALPEAWRPATSEESAAPTSASGQRRDRGPGAKVSDSPWLITPFVPARVFSSRDRVTLASEPRDRHEQKSRVAQISDDRPARRGGSSEIVRGARQADRVGQRLAQASHARDPIARALESAPERLDGRTHAAVKRALTLTEWMEPEERVVELRRVLRSRASARVIRTVIEEVLPESAARPATVAAARMSSAPQKKAMGLRPVMHSSPLMATMQPQLSANESVQTEQSDARRPSTPARQRPAAWALSRKYRESTSRLAVSSVGRSASGTAQSAVPQSLSQSPMPRSAARAAARRLTRRSMMGTPDQAILRPVSETLAEPAPAAAGKRQQAAPTRTPTRREVTPVESSARVARTPSSERSTSEAHRTPRSEHTGAQAARTPSGDRSVSEAHRTPRGEHIGAPAARTPSGERSVSEAHRTPAGERSASEAHRTPSGERSASEAHRTPAGERSASEAHRTPSGERSVSATHRTPSGELERSQPAQRATVAEESRRTERGSQPSVPATGAATARRGRAPSASASSVALDVVDGPWDFATTVADDVGSPRAAASAHAMQRLASFLGAPTAGTAGLTSPLEAVLPRASAARSEPSQRVGGVSWAAERLEQTGLPQTGGRHSVLPRMAPVMRDQPVVISVSSEAEAREVEAQVKKALPQADVRVREASPWLITPFTPARVVRGGGREARSAVEAAVARQLESPITSQSAGRLGGAAGGRTPSAAVGRSRVRTGGPVQYAARSGPDQVGLIPGVSGGAWAGAAVMRTSSGEYVPVSAVKTPSSSLQGAKVVRTEAGRYVAASSVKTPGTTFSASELFRTPSGEYIASRASRTGRSPFVGAVTASTLSGEWSGASSFRTPGGSTAASAGFRTPAGDRSAMSGVRTARSTWEGAGTYLTPSGEWAGARSATTPAGSFVGARVGEGRPMDWVGARMNTTPSSGYRGAFATRTPDAEYIGAGAFRTPAGEFEGAPVAAGGPRGRRQPGRRLPGAGARSDLVGTLAGLSYGDSAGLPGWADRASSPVAVRTVTEFVSSLARANNPNQVVEIILSRGDEVRGSSLLPQPVIRVIEQIQSATSAPERETLGTPGTVRGTTTRSVRGSTGARRSSARVLSGWTGLPVGASAPSAQGVGADRVAKLAKKLKNLIHLAENQNRLSEAQRQVRLAASDAPSARLGGGSEMGEAEAAEQANVDIEALGREVLELVNREQELRRERRPEATDGSSWW